MDIDSMIEVLQAYKDGKKIQYLYLNQGDDWCDTPDPFWNFSAAEYRVKPAPFTTMVAVSGQLNPVEVVELTDEVRERLKDIL